MPITVSCPKCGKGFLAPDHGAGLRTNCRACGASIDIPEPTPAIPKLDLDEEDAPAVSLPPRPSPAKDPTPDVVLVRVVGVRMPFWMMVDLAVRWMAASMLAALILSPVVGVAWLLYLAIAAIVKGSPSPTP